MLYRKSCYLYLFYIKPQLLTTSLRLSESCFLYLFYIKPQLKEVSYCVLLRCFLYLFYIKPQPMLVYRLIINDIYRKYHFKNKGSGLK